MEMSSISLPASPHSPPGRVSSTGSGGRGACRQGRAISLTCAGDAPAWTVAGESTRSASNSAKLESAAASSLCSVRRDGLPWRRMSAQIVRLTPAFTAQAFAVRLSGLSRIRSSSSCSPASGISPPPGPSIMEQCLIDQTKSPIIVRCIGQSCGGDHAGAKLRRACQLQRSSAAWRRWRRVPARRTRGGRRGDRRGGRTGPARSSS